MSSVNGEGRAFQERDWHEQRHRVRAHEACLSHSQWTTQNALNGSHERAPGDKVNKEVRLPGPRSDPPSEAIWQPMKARAF